jgi:hypothetical protein
MNITKDRSAAEVRTAEKLWGRVIDAVDEADPPSRAASCSGQP